MFGLPVVMNPILIIPMILTSMLGIGIGTISTIVGFMGHTYVLIPWTTPPIISAYLASGANIGAIITTLIIFIISVLIYMPFVKLSNKQVSE